MLLKRLFSRPEQPETRQWSVPVGRRVYAIGDIHGRLDLLNRLLGAIDADDARRPDADTTLVILGDLVDRGPESRGVVERLRHFKMADANVILLKGNHEELLIGVWDGERELAGTFNRAGGRATLMSYGVDGDDYDSWDLGAMTEATRQFVPQSHIEFLRSFEDWHKIGDYLFVHAGIRPGYDIEDQDPTDLRWIRREFTDADTDYGAMIIHGHTITDSVEERHNRIGIDTGAFASGVLTAVGLEGTDRWFLST